MAHPSSIHRDRRVSRVCCCSQAASGLAVEDLADPEPASRRGCWRGCWRCRPGHAYLHNSFPAQESFQAASAPAVRDHAAKSQSRARRLEIKMLALAAAHEAVTQPRRAGDVLTTFEKRLQPCGERCKVSKVLPERAAWPLRRPSQTGGGTPCCYSLRRPLWHTQVLPTVAGGRLRCAAAVPSSLQARC